MALFEQALVSGGAARPHHRALHDLGAEAEPLGQSTVLLKDQEAPGNLNHATANTSVARLGQALLAPSPPALVWRTGKAGVARHSPAIPQRTGKDLVHEHVRGFDANALDAGEDTDHRMHSFFGSLRDSIQARLLNLRDLVHDEA